MAVVAVSLHWAISALSGKTYLGNLIATLVAIAVAAVVYITMLLILRVMDKDDILLLPKGNIIYNLLVKLKLYK